MYVGDVGAAVLSTNGNIYTMFPHGEYAITRVCAVCKDGSEMPPRGAPGVYDANGRRRAGYRGTGEQRRPGRPSGRSDAGTPILSGGAAVLSFAFPAAAYREDVHAFYAPLETAGETCIGYGGCGTMTAGSPACKTARPRPARPQGMCGRTFTLSMAETRWSACSA